MELRLALVAATLVALTLPLSSCARKAARPAAGGELETVDVSAAPDAAASLAEDGIEQRRAEPAGGVAGALPEGFPKEVPLPTPSSLVDFAAAGSGGLSVTLEIQESAAAVESSYRRRLQAAGFASGADGVWRRDGRSLRFSVESHQGVARLVLEVLPRSAPR